MKKILFFCFLVSTSLLANTNYHRIFLGPNWQYNRYEEWVADFNGYNNWGAIFGYEYRRPQYVYGMARGYFGQGNIYGTISTTYYHYILTQGWGEGRIGYMFDTEPFSLTKFSYNKINR